MKERPILFSAPMVRALIAGTKTQTRRVVKPQPPADKQRSAWYEPGIMGWAPPEIPSQHWHRVRCPYGQPGDRLWVREAWAKIQPLCLPWPQTMIVYREGDNRTDYGGPWKPGIHMFRRDSRITLEVTGVRVERLQDISEEDAIAEGCTQNHNGYFWGGPHAVSGLKQMATAKQAYSDLWESINGPGSWEANPWVWVVEFKRLEDAA